VDTLARMSAPTITIVGEDDLDDLLPLVRGYLDFYEVRTGDEEMLALSRALIADPDREGVQLLARDGSGRAVGFASLFWTWTTTRGGRLGIMNDLFVAPQARGSGLADALIAACADQCRARGVRWLEWQTGLDNHRAQAVYERVGARRSQWLDYSLDVA
jgi:GNAT superfamily N-acetyltransferase